MTVQAYNPKAPNNPVPTSNPQTSTELLQISEPNQAHAKPSDGSCGCGGTHNHSHDHNHHHHTHAHSHSHEPEFFDDGIRVMPTSDDLKRLSSDAELIQRAISEENANHSNLIASSRQSVPTITVNGVLISEQAIGEEVQYHPADSQDEALFLSAQALVIRELLRQAVMADDELKDEWQADDENAISKLIAKNVRPNTPTDSICEQYYTANQGEFTAPPVMKVRHILFACPPEEGEERIELKKRAYELIDTIKTHAIDKLGKITHYKVAMKPGKPFVFGELYDNADSPKTVLYFGLPGNPLSCVVGCLQFVIPAFWRLSGVHDDELPKRLTLRATLSHDIKKRAGRKEFMRGIYHQDEFGKFVVQAVGVQDSHRIKQLSLANCLIVANKDSEGYLVGDEITIEPFGWGFY